MIFHFHLVFLQWSGWQWSPWKLNLFFGLLVQYWRKKQSHFFSPTLKHHFPLICSHMIKNLALYITTFINHNWEKNQTFFAIILSPPAHIETKKQMGKMNSFAWVLILLCTANFLSSFAHEDSQMLRSKDFLISSHELSLSDLEEHGEKLFIHSWNVVNFIFPLLVMCIEIEIVNRFWYKKTYGIRKYYLDRKGTERERILWWCKRSSSATSRKKCCTVL